MHTRSLISHYRFAAFLAVFALLALAACAPASPAAPAQAPAAPQATVATPAQAPAAPPQSSTSASGQVPASAGPAVDLKVVRVQNFGLFLTDANGRTLYMFDKDTTNTSNCTTGTCLQNWPPYTAQGTVTADPSLDKTKLGTAARPDGAMQVTFDGHPLYYFAGDKNPGDVKGQGVAGLWHVVSPRGNPMNNAYPAAATPTP